MDSMKSDAQVLLPYPKFRLKSNRFQFFEDEKKTQNFARTNSKHSDIYRDEKYILVELILIINFILECFLSLGIEHGIRRFTTLTHPTQPIELDLLG